MLGSMRDGHATVADLSGRALLTIAACAAVMTASPAAAQQRSILNTGFEDGPDLPAPGGFFIRSDSSTAGWTSTNGELEIWNSGHQGIASSSGGYHAELNPNSPIGLYQEICLQNGETLGWSFDHRNRDDGGSRPNPQVAVLEVVNSSGSALQTLTTQTSFAGTGWITNSGTTTYTGPTGVHRLQFRSTNPGSVGNLLDNIQVSLVPYAELSSSSGSDVESAGGNMIQLAVSGNVETAFSIPFTITGGTATNGADYTVTAASVAVPVGNYDGVSASSRFTLPITINDDSAEEPNETIIIEIASIATGAVQVASHSCSATPTTLATYTITDDDAAPVAVDDIMTTPISGPVTIDPLANDHGTSIDPASVILTGTGAPTGSTLAPDGKTLTMDGEGVWTANATTGAVTFTPSPGFTGTPSPAAYTVENAAGRRSNEATISLNATATILAVADAVSTVDTASGGVTSTVLANDRLNGSPITDASAVTLTAGAAPSPAAGSISMNPDGTITVAPGTTAGTYSYSYQICDAANPTNCSTALATVVVGTTSLIAEIEDDLINVLEDDRAATVTQLSQQMNGFAAEAGQRLRSRRQGEEACSSALRDILERDPILFDTDKSIIKPESEGVLDRLTEVLLQCSVSAFEIAGHTDSDASESYNLALSQRRVDAVLRALTARGVDTRAYLARGYGEARPIASNATPDGKARNRRVEFVPLGSGNATTDCGSHGSSRALDASANDRQTEIEGHYLNETHDCARNVREIYETTLSHLETDLGQAQSMLNFSFRRERIAREQAIRGFFVGGYITNNDISETAEGDIHGLGVNGGLYGADQLSQNLFLDYYVGAGFGLHDFDLSFDALSGTNTTVGDYSYFAGFAGVAISGEFPVGQRSVHPRLGLDYMYSPKSDVEISTLNGAEISETLELDTLSGGRLFAEIGTEWPLRHRNAQLSITPRVACYESIDGLAGVCGAGASLELASTEQSAELAYAFELDAEIGDGYQRGSISGRLERALDTGTFTGSASLRSSGAVAFGGAFELVF